MCVWGCVGFGGVNGSQHLFHIVVIIIKKSVGGGGLAVCAAGMTLPHAVAFWWLSASMKLLGSIHTARQRCADLHTAYQWRVLFCRVLTSSSAYVIPCDYFPTLISNERRSIPETRIDQYAFQNDIYFLSAFVCHCLNFELHPPATLNCKTTHSLRTDCLGEVSDMKHFRSHWTS